MRIFVPPNLLKGMLGASTKAKGLLFSCSFRENKNGEFYANIQYFPIEEMIVDSEYNV